MKSLKKSSDHHRNRFSMQMTILLAALTSVGVAVPTQAASAADADSQKVAPSVEFEKIYIPLGFDDNDQIEIVGEGVLKDPCDRVRSTGVHVNAEAKTVEVFTRVRHLTSDCGAGVQSFQQTIQVGVLKPGDYAIQQDGRALGVLNVVHSENAAEDSSSFLPVSTISIASVNDPAAGNHWVLHLKGTFPSNCVDFKSAKIDVQPDVILVLPIGRLWEFGCIDSPIPFDVSLQLPDGIQPNRYLLHVRAAHGQSVNEIFDLK